MLAYWQKESMLDVGTCSSKDEIGSSGLQRMVGKDSKGGRISVIVVDDHEVVRVGLRALLAADASIDVVGEASSGREAVALAKELRPKIVLMDLAMPLLNGMEATRQILQDCSTIRVIALSSYNDDEHVQQALAAGASGYLLKGMAPANLLRALHEVHEGRRCFSPAIADRIVENEMGSGGAAVANSAAKLSIREAEVLQLIAEGMANKQIANELHLSIKTVEKHRHALMGKLDLHSVADLVRYAIARKKIEGACAEESQVDA
jgi:DNA-binding NarL/FixJ family response regulator